MFFDSARNSTNRLGVGGLTTEDKMFVYLITYILHIVNHFVIILLTFTSEPHIQLLESSLRAFTLFPFGSLDFLLSSGGLLAIFRKETKGLEVEEG